MGEHGLAVRLVGVGAFAGRRRAAVAMAIGTGCAAARIVTGTGFRSRDPGSGPGAAGLANPAAKYGRRHMTGTERGT